MDRNRIVLGYEHLRANEYQKRRQPVVQVMEDIHQSGEREKQRAKPHDGEDVGGVHDESIPGDRQNGGDGIGCERNVGQLDDEQDDKKWRSVALGVTPHEELAAFVTLSYRYKSAEKAQKEILFRFDVASLRAQHGKSLEDQECTE